MDCLRAREIVSEAFDRGVASVPESAEAREHCRSCHECRAFVEGLGMLERIPPPIAPPYLVEEIVERTRRMAAANLPPIVGRRPAPDEGTAAGQGDAAATEPLVTPVPAPRPRWTAGRVTALAAAVLVGVFAVSLSLQGFSALRSPAPDATALMDRLENGGAETAASGTAGGYGAAAPEGSGSGTRDLEAARASGARYVAFEGQAYFWLGLRTPEGDTLVPVGNLTSSLDSTNGPEEHAVWRSRSDGDVIFIRPDDDQEGYTAFRRATRSFNGKAYALYAADLPAYGTWPALPSQYATPTATDGSPTFSAAGKDDSGLEIFAPAGASPEAGFAVAPNTTPGDAAGGNPNWTWWVPRP